MSNKQTHNKTGGLPDIKHGKTQTVECECVWTHRRKIKREKKNEYQEAA